MKELKRYDENLNIIGYPKYEDYYLKGEFLEDSYNADIVRYNQAKTADELLAGLVEENRQLLKLNDDFQGHIINQMDLISRQQSMVKKLKADHKDRIEHALKAQSEFMDEMVKKDERIKELEHLKNRKNQRLVNGRKPRT